VRGERAGFDGVELHGAHGYMLGQYLSGDLNRREDRYGGSLENRSRLLFEIIDGVRASCGPNFQLGVRLSAEHFGIRIADAIEVSKRLFAEGNIDYLDMSLWDAFKQPSEEAFQGRSLLSCFADLDRGSTRLGAGGKIQTAAQAAAVIAQGVDFAIVGRAAILHHNYAKLVRLDEAFIPATLPVTPAHLAQEGLSPAFVAYMSQYFQGFVAEPAAQADQSSGVAQTAS
jgi:2,4-dienoyl-CoA reductase-like NADH-dependent reductase (Old Yellow Enzyme family)